MSKKIYVGNLPFAFTDQDLGDLFAQNGEVSSARIVTDRATGRSRGFGFVEMPGDAEADAAISKLNGMDVQGRPLTVNEARPQAPREGGGGGRGGFGGGGGRGGFGGGRGGREGGRGGRDGGGRGGRF